MVIAVDRYSNNGVLDSSHQKLQLFRLCKSSLSKTRTNRNLVEKELQLARIKEERVANLKNGGLREISKLLLTTLEAFS